MKTRAILTRLFSVVAASVVLSTLVVTGGSALAASRPADPAVDAQVAAILDANPGAKRLNATSVLLAPGALMTVPGEAEPGATLAVPAQDGGTLQVAASSSSCTYQYLCLWDGTYRSGARLMLYYCSNQYLSSYAFPSGGDWRNRVTSAWNYQSGSATASFHDYGVLTGYRRIGGLTPGNYLQDMSRDAAIGGGNLNNRIDMIRPC